MGQKLSVQYLKSLLRQIDWKLLLFLLLFLNVKLIIKIVSVIIIYIVRPNMRFGISWKKSRLPLFYVFIIAIAIVNAIIYRSFFSGSNAIAVVTGISFWILCLLAIHQLKLSVEETDTSVLHNTVLLFFAINILFSFGNIAAIIFQTGDINPYRYQGEYQKYFIETGDYIRGVSFDTSTTNAAINAFAVVYFLIRQKASWVLLSMVALLLTASNFTNVVLLIALVVLFIFRSTADQKSLMVICCAMLVIFLSKVSPNNDQYILSAVNNYLVHKKPVVHPASLMVPIIEREDASLSPDERMQKVALLYLDSLSKIEAKDKTVAAKDAMRKRPFIPSNNILTPYFQRKRDTTELQHSLITFAHTDRIALRPIEDRPSHTPYLGKLEAAIETINFFKAHPAKIINGNGIGNFSSKLAFRSTALHIAGGYPSAFRYINDDFKNNHLSLFLSYFTSDKENHSIINTPNSTYDQIVSEYGLLGISAFVFFYGGFFISHFKKLTYGIPLLLIMGGMFFVEYWFEQLSVVVIFELLLLLDIKEQRQPINFING